MARYSVKPYLNTPLEPTELTRFGTATVDHGALLKRTEPIQVHRQPMQMASNGTPDRAITVDRVTLTQGSVTAKLSLYHSGPDVRVMDPAQPTMLYIPGVNDTQDENPFAEADKGQHINHVTLDRSYVGPQSQIHIPSAQGLMDEARLALTWLNSTMGKPISVAGFSLGGHMAARLASENPSQVRSLHLMSPTFLPPGRHWFFMNVLNPVLYRGVNLLNWVLIKRGKPPWPTLVGKTDTELTHLTRPKDHKAIFEGIQAPIHVSLGENEPLQPWYIQSLLRHSPSVAKQLTVIANESHIISQPERVDRTLLFHQRYA